jgi:hypothetical protein
MANLVGSDIGLNYKGLINIGSLVNQNVSASLQFLTDGDGNNLPIQVSTTTTQINYGVGIGVAPSSTIGLYVNGQAGTTGLAFTGASATMYIDLNGSGINFFDATQTRYRNFAGTTLAMNVWGNLGMVAIGGSATTPYTPSALLHVRGDGTNLTGRFEASDGTAILTVPATATNISTLMFRGFYLGFGNSSNALLGIETNRFVFYNGTNRFIVEADGTATIFNSITTNTTLQTLVLRTSVALSTINIPRFSFVPTGNVTTISGTSQGISYTDTFAAGAGSANYRPLSITYTVNNTGAQTGNTTGIFLNATLTNLNGMTHNLMDLQVGGVSAFRAANSPMGIGIQTSGSWIAYNNSPVQLVGIQGGAFYVLNSTVFFQIDLGNGDTRNVGNLFLGSVAVIPTSRLQVRGNGVNPIARFENNAGTARMIINDNGRINMAALPTSSAGLSAGDLWNNAGVVNIV